MRRLGAFGLLALLAPGSGCSRQEPPAPVRPANVLLITLDTTRADRIGAYGYAGARTPHLDALARGGVRFDQAIAPAPITGPSHAGMLTGLHPGRLGIRDNATVAVPESAVTLGEILSGRGFATGGFIGAFVLDRPYGFAQGFGTFASGFTRVESGREAKAERRGDAVVDDAIAWLSSLPPQQPFFAWVHLYDPHAVYTPPEPFASQFAGSPYDGEIAFVDQQVGRVLDLLRGRGALERTLAMVVGDHGESLGEHDEDEHGVFLYDAVLRVPFIAAGPGVAAGHVAQEQVRAIDVFPTILDVLGAGVPGSIDGRSVAAQLRGEKPSTPEEAYAETHYPRLHYGWSELRALRADGWKVIDAPRPELYDLRKDPGERNNLYEQNRALADRMIGVAARIGRELDANEAAEPKQPDSETLERLRSLGYIGVSAVPRSGTRGPDPKDRVAQRRQYHALMPVAIDELRGGKPAAAAEKLRRLVTINPRAYDLHNLLGEAYQRQGKLAEALGEYEMAALLNPGTAAPLLSAAEVHLARDDVASARKRLAEAERLDPQSFDVALVTGLVLEQERKPDDAIAAYRKAVRLNPANPRPRVQIVALSSAIGRWSVAEGELRELLAMRYQPSRTHFALGRAAQVQGRNADAERHYREALRLEPGLPMAVQGLRSLGLR